MAIIAWIEDDYDRISSLIALVARDGHEILTYGSAQEVMDRFDEVCCCDAVVLDIMLPPTDPDPYPGVAILDALRQRGYEAPVIVCSRVKNPVVLHELGELGVSDILTKPVRPSELLKSVRAVLGSGD